MMTLSGWEGDKVVVNGDANRGDKKAPVRPTVTRPGEEQMAGVFEMGGPEGKLGKVAEEHCKKK